MGGMLAEKLAEDYSIHERATEEEQLEFWQRALKKHPHIKIKNLEDAPMIPTRVISKTIENILTEKAKQTNIKKWKAKIAPQALIKKDLIRTTKLTPTLFIGSEMRQAFNIRAIPGHAQNGDGKFNGVTNEEGANQYFTNTTTQYILEAVENINEKEIQAKIRRKKSRRARKTKNNKKVKTPKPTKADRRRITKRNFQLRAQRGNDNIVHKMEYWLQDMLENPARISSTSPSQKLRTGNNPLNGMSCFKGTEVDMLEFLRGFYLAANMDSFEEVRKPGSEKYGHQPGGGECFLGRTSKLQEHGVGITDLSGINYQGALKILNYLPHETRVKILEDIGVIDTKALPLEEIAAGNFTWNKIKQHPSTTNLTKNPDLWGQYLRDTKGEGVGDDIVIFLSGFLPPSIYEEKHKESQYAVQSRILGALLADQMDTVEKDAAFFMPGGQDKIAALHLNGLFNKLCNLKVRNIVTGKDKDYGEIFRKRFGIKERADQQYDLVPHDEVVDYTMAGVNTPAQHVHSSQRWFYMDKEGTCAIKEYMKYAYHVAKGKHKKTKLKDLVSFGIDLDDDSSTKKFTFREIPLEKILKIMEERLDLVSNPKRRETELKEYHSP